MHKQFDSRLDQSWWLLRIGLGVGPFLAGLDKYFNFLANWPAYISPLALKMLPFSGQTFMHIVGVIEMIVGLAILTRWTRFGAYVASAWLVAIAVNLVDDRRIPRCRGERSRDGTCSLRPGSTHRGSGGRLTPRSATRQ